MKSKKKGADKKSWIIDCRTDCAFDFALKVLKEAKNTKYPFELRVNFIRIAYSNTLEVIAKCQTNPKEFKLETAMKLLDRNLRAISKVSAELFKLIDRGYPTNIAEEKYVGTVELLNPYDFIDIDYPSLAIALQKPRSVAYSLDKYSWYSDKNDEKIYKCAQRYHYPKIYQITKSQKLLPFSFLTELLPTNDIKIHRSTQFAELLDKYNHPIDEFYSTKTAFTSEYSQYIEDLYQSMLNSGSTKIYTPDSELLHVPYDSIETLTNLVWKASLTSKIVTEIGITAYRLGKNSSLIDSICTATKNKIHCKIYIELSARGETQQDLDYILKLLKDCDPEYLDIKVEYNGLKVHGKMIYIDLCNNETIGIFSTGNYNQQTAKIYKDYHYISCDKSVTTMIKHNFSILWNSEQPVLSSISNILTKEIYEEIEKGKDGRIWIQANHLDNQHIVTLLREAIKRGCDVKLIVRTTKGFHKNDIKNCKSVVGKYLEHARVYIFGDGYSTRVYLSSSDILFRNLYNRFESYVKITDTDSIGILVNDFADLYKNGQR